jgi:hypothetical protein
MVAAAERRKLDQFFVAAYRLQAWMTQRRVRNVRRRSERIAPIPATRWYGAAESSEDSAGYPRILDCGGLHVEANRQHAAPDVAAYGLRIDQVRRRNNHADADVRSEMHIWHDGYLLDVWRTSEAFDRLRHVMVHRLRQPRPDWGD